MFLLWFSDRSQFNYMNYIGPQSNANDGWMDIDDPPAKSNRNLGLNRHQLPEVPEVPEEMIAPT